MSERAISNLDIKLKLLVEYLNNDGVSKISDPGLLEELLSLQHDVQGNIIPSSIGPRMNSFMLALLADHTSPPFCSSEHISEYKSTIQKATSFDQENIESQEQFDELYEEYRNRVGFLFRGQREAKWRLYSRLQRVWIQQQYAQRGIEYTALLTQLSKLGEATYRDKILGLLENYSIDSLNSIAVLGFLQHHGCPTPLLDWTSSFLNALYFGIDGISPNDSSTEIGEYFSVYFIDETDMESGSMSRLLHDSIKTVEKEMLPKVLSRSGFGQHKKEAGLAYFKQWIKESGMVKAMLDINLMKGIPLIYFSDRDATSEIIFSLNNSKNIINQAGVFTWVADPIKPLEVVGNEQYAQAIKQGEPTEYRFCKCFNINKKLVGHVRMRLEADGITNDFIYPTPDINTAHVLDEAIALLL